MSLVSEYQGMCQVDLVDLVVELPNVNPTVGLRERGGQRRELWFPIGQADGVTLAIAWRGTATPRPLTHELMSDIFVRFGLDVDAVRITGRSGKSYVAELVLSREGVRQNVSCRPTDALNLALRRLVPVPIMVAEELMQPGSPEPEPEPEPEFVEPMTSAWPFDTPEPEVWPPLDWPADGSDLEPEPEPPPPPAATEPAPPAATEPPPPAATEPPPPATSPATTVKGNVDTVHNTFHSSHGADSEPGEGASASG
ncbi:MAG: bifunctional nuclease family protein [Acidimicrobiales bacterium]